MDMDSILRYYFHCYWLSVNSNFKIKLPRRSNFITIVDNKVDK